MITIHVLAEVAHILPAAILVAAGVAVFYILGATAAVGIFGVGEPPGRHERTSPRSAAGDDEPRATRMRASSNATGKGVTGE